MDPQPKRSFDQVREAIQRKHYSSSTGESYAHWIKCFILFHGKRHPSEMAAQAVGAFLTHQRMMFVCPKCVSAVNQSISVSPCSR